jgi:hypothetical protein
MPDLAVSKLKPFEEKITELNASKVSSKEDAIKTLEELKRSGGDLQRKSVLLGEIERKFLGKLDIYSIDSVIEALNSQKIEPKEKEVYKQDNKNEERRTYQERDEVSEFREKKEVEKIKKEVEEKAEELSNAISNNLDADEKTKKVVKEEIEKIIKSEEVKSSEEEISDLATRIEREMEGRSKTEIEVEAKKARLELEKWEKQNIKDLREYRKDNFKEKVVSEALLKNPSITEQQKVLLDKQANLVAEIYFGEHGIEDQKDAALSFNKEVFSPGELQNAWVNLEGITNLLYKSPKEVKRIKEEYQKCKDGLQNIQLPFEIKQIGSFDGIMAMLKDQAGGQLFSKVQSYMGWADNIDKLSGGWLSRNMVNVGEKFIGHIGNQSIQAFAQNSLNVLAKEGFQKGFTTIMNGVLSGGVKAGATAAAGGTTAGVAAAGTGAAAGTAAAAGLSATGIGAIVVAAALILKKIVDIGKKIKDKLGLSLGIKNFLQETFGKFLGGLLDFGIKASLILIGLPALIGGLALPSMFAPALIGAIGGGFAYQMYQEGMVSSLVPPTDSEGDFESENSDIPNFQPGEITIPSVTIGNVSRQDLINIAMSLRGKVTYFWGGKWYNLGANPEWGEMRQVKCGDPSENKYCGKMLPMGLDCSGYVTWVYYQATGKAIAGGSASMLDKARSGEWQIINESQIKPGDIAYRPGHVALYIGDTPEGDHLYIHAYSSGKPIEITSDTTRYEGRAATSPFTMYFRPNVTFTN